MSPIPDMDTLQYTSFSYIREKVPPGHFLVIGRLGNHENEETITRIPQAVGSAMHLSDRLTGTTNLWILTQANVVIVNWRIGATALVAPGEPLIQLTYRQQNRFMSDVVRIKQDTEDTKGAQLVERGWEVEVVGSLGVYHLSHHRTILCHWNPTVVVEQHNRAVIVVAPNGRAISLMVTDVVNRARQIELERARAEGEAAQVVAAFEATDMEWTRQIEVQDFADDVGKCGICWDHYSEDIFPSS